MGARQHTRRVQLCLIATLTVFALEMTAAAQSESETAAQAHFEAGLALLRAGRFADACPRLEASVRIEPAMGARFRLAECYEGLGRYASAWRLYGEVADHARAAQQDVRESEARAKVQQLRPRVPWLIVRVPKSVRRLDGFRVDVDGNHAVLDEGESTPLAVDPGPHAIRVSAAALYDWSTKVTATEGASTAVEAPLTTPRAAPTRSPPQAATSSGEILSPGRIGGIVVGSLGVAGIGVGAALGFVAKSQWDDAKSDCADDLRQCGPGATDDADAAYQSAVGSTVAFIAGGAAVATGVVLWFALPPRDDAPPVVSLRLTPTRDAAGGIAEGTLAW